MATETAQRTSPSNTLLLQCRGLTVRLHSSLVLDGIDLDVHAEEWMTILGRSGSGKSTLLRALAGQVPLEGSVSIENRDVSSTGVQGRARRGLAVIVDSPSVFRTLSVDENLRVGAVGNRRGPWNRKEIYRLFPGLERRKDILAGELSRGEQHAISIGRAIVANPSVLLIDEPGSGVNALVRNDLIDALSEVAATGMTIVTTQSEPDMRTTSRGGLVCLASGRITDQGPAQSFDRARLEQALVGPSSREASDATTGSSITVTNTDEPVEAVHAADLFADAPDTDRSLFDREDNSYGDTR